jgi:hypothetical protein
MLDNYRDLIDELLETPGTLRTLLTDRAAPVDPEGLDLIRELRDRDRVVHQRLQTFLREANPQLRALGPPTGSAPADADEDVETLLSSFDSARGELVSLLMNLTLRDWERTAGHDVEGEISLAEEVERHVEFDEDHVARIEQAASGSA